MTMVWYGRRKNLDGRQEGNESTTYYAHRSRPKLHGRERLGREIDVFSEDNDIENM